MFDAFFENHKDHALFRAFFGSENTESYYLMTEEEDKLFDRVINTIGILSMIGLIVSVIFF